MIKFKVKLFLTKKLCSKTAFTNRMIQQRYIKTIRKHVLSQNQTFYNRAARYILKTNYMHLFIS